MNNGKITIVDVRTPGEFMGGHVVGSVNIPLNEIMERLEEIKSMKQPIILCCASGGRSGQALCVIIGISVIGQSLSQHQWLGIMLGVYLSAMGLFAFGCASGNCAAGNCDVEEKVN